jgi:hypothetical protein
VIVMRVCGAVRLFNPMVHGKRGASTYTRWWPPDAVKLSLGWEESEYFKSWVEDSM